MSGAGARLPEHLRVLNEVVGSWDRQRPRGVCREGCLPPHALY